MDAMMAQSNLSTSTLSEAELAEMQEVVYKNFVAGWGYIPSPKVSQPRQIQGLLSKQRHQSLTH